MPSHQVFLGAPSSRDLLETPARDWESRQWSSSVLTIETPLLATVLTDQSQDYAHSEAGLAPPASRMDSRINSQPSWLLDILPEQTFKEASHRIEDMYKNVIFDDDEDDEESFALSIDDMERSVVSANQTTRSDKSNDLDISWEPSVLLAKDPDLSLIRPGDGDTSKKTSFLSSLGEISTEPDSQFEESQDTSGEGNSISRFPSFHFSLHKLSSLGTVLKAPVRRKERKIVSLLVAILEVDGPTSINTKSGVEMALLKLIIGDEAGAVAKITVWRETAEEWSGSDNEGVGLKRGDVVLLENISVNYAPPIPPTLSASPTEHSRHTICYRTMPLAAFDRKYRPDLRLGISDSAIRKVSMVVDWVEDMAGLRQK